MKINDNGIVREATPKEIADIERMAAEFSAPEPTAEDRMNEIEAALIELASMLAGGGV